MPTPPTPDQPADHDAACLGMVRGLAELGMELACAVQANALAQVQAATDGGKAAPDVTGAFDRIARCVRRTVLLIHHLMHPRPQRARQPSPWRADDAARRAAVRRRVLRAVQDGIGREADTDERAERLGREALERLDAPEFENDIAAGRPVAEMVEEVLRDLGLAARAGLPPPIRRTPSDVVALAAWAAAPRGAPGAPAAPASPPPAPPDALAPDALAHEMARLLSGAPRFQPGDALDPVAALSPAHRALDGPDDG